VTPSPERASREARALTPDEERALLIERVRFVFGIGPNEMFPPQPAARLPHPEPRAHASE
jgi:hypothetical protein